jgi:hypothetical protein
MPKALALTDLEAPAMPPQAATLGKAAAKDAQILPLQIRIPRADLKSIKRAAVEEEKTLSAFMLECFHAYMQTRKGKL